MSIDFETIKDNTVIVFRAIAYTVYGAALLTVATFAAYANHEYISNDKLQNGLYIAIAIAVVPVAHSIGRAVFRLIRELAEGK